MIPNNLRKALRNLDKIKTKKQAEKLLKEYSKYSEFAASNIGYIIGYYDEKTRKRLHKLFNVSHPIFGREY